jgi:hypothetical protein
VLNFLHAFLQKHAKTVPASASFVAWSQMRHHFEYIYSYYSMFNCVCNSGYTSSLEGISMQRGKKWQNYEMSLISKLARLWRTQMWTQDQCFRKINKIYNLQQKEPPPLWKKNHTRITKNKAQSKQMRIVIYCQGTYNKGNGKWLFVKRGRDGTFPLPYQWFTCLSITNDHWLNFCITSSKQFDRFIYISLDNKK